MLSRLKKQDGSMIIGWLLLTTILIAFFIFAYESALLFIEKEKLQNIADNISSAAILEIDEREFENGELQIHETNALLSTNRLLDETFKDGEKPYTELYVLNNDGDKVLIEDTEFQFKENPSVIFFIKSKSNRDYAFFKETEINVVSRSQVYSTVNLKEFDFKSVDKKTFYNNILKFENR